MIEKQKNYFLRCCLICLIFCTMVYSQNLILNGDFESGDTGSPDYLPLNWTAIGSTSRLSLVTPPGDGNSSSHCVRLTNSSDPDDISPGFYQESTTLLAADTIYHFNADFRFNTALTTYPHLKMDIGYFSGDTFNVLKSETFDVEDYEDERWQTRMVEYTTGSSGGGIGNEIAVSFSKVDEASFPDSLQLYWKLDETSGSTAYDSAEAVSGMDGTVSGATWSVSGQYDGCLSFDGTDDYVALAPGDGTALDPQEDSWTLALWVATTDTTQFGGIANKGNQGSGDEGWMLYTYNGVLYFRVRDDSGHSASISATLPTDGNWHQILCVIDRSTDTLKGYLDDDSMEWTTADLSSVANIEADEDFQIGCRAGPCSYFDGWIDDVRVYNEAISTTEQTLSVNHLYVDNISVYKPNFITTAHGLNHSTSNYVTLFNISSPDDPHHSTWQDIQGVAYGSVTPAITEDGTIYIDYFRVYDTPNPPNSRVAFSTDEGISFRDLDSWQVQNVNGLATVWCGRAFGQEKIFRTTPASYFYTNDDDPNDPTWHAYSRNFSWQGEPPTHLVNYPFSQSLMSVREVYTMSGSSVVDSYLKIFYSTDGGDYWSDGMALPDPYDLSPYLYRLPTTIISPEGDQMMILAGLNDSDRLTRMWLSKNSAGDEWTNPQTIDQAACGDRHFVGYTENYEQDGRLVLEYRDILTPLGQSSRFDAMAWVGTFDDLAYGRKGQYRIRLWDHTGDWYGGMVTMPPDPCDPNDENEYLVFHENHLTRFSLSEFDSSLTSTASKLSWHLKMDETSGDYVTDSEKCSKLGPNPYGSKVGPSWYTGGQYDGCLSFDGTNDYVGFNTYDWDGLDPKERNWSISFWYQTTDRSQFGGIINKGNQGSTNPGYLFYIYSGTMYLRVCDVNSTGASVSASIPDNSNWHHVVLVIDGDNDTMTGYLDGSSSGFGTVSLASLGSIECASNFELGCRNGPSTYFEGCIDDVRVYEKALTSLEISNL